MKPSHLATLALASLLAAGTAHAEEKVKVFVVPYAPLFDSIPRTTGERIGDTLRGELGNNEAFEVVPLSDDAAALAASDAGPKRGASEAQSRAVDAARADLEKGKSLLAKRKVKPALDTLGQVIAAYEKNPEAVTDVKPLVQAYLKQAVALFLMGKEDEAVRRPIPAALRLDPSLRLEAGEEYAPVFVNEVEKARKKLLAGGYGALRVDTTPPGAQVQVDDREAANTPVLVKGLFPGLHFVKIKPPGGEWYVQKIEIKADDTARITPDAVARKEGLVAGLVTYLGKNQLDEGARKQVKAVADKTGSSFVVIGGAFAKGANMEIASLVYSTKKDAFSELQRITLDRDMLGATIEINKLSGEVGFKADAFGEGLKLPRALAADAKAGEEKINEVDLAGAAVAAGKSESRGTPAGGAAGAVGGGAGGGRTPIGPGRRPITGAGSRPEDAAVTPPPSEAPRASIGIKERKRPAAATHVDESGLVFKTKDDFKPKEDEKKQDEKARKYMVGGSIEDEKTFEQAGDDEGGILSRWWFWAGAAVIAGGAVTGGILAGGGDEATAAQGTAKW